jgi:hypothetical protein
MTSRTNAMQLKLAPIQVSQLHTVSNNTIMANTENVYVKTALTAVNVGAEFAGA